jgi:hypothetical protein
MTRRECIVAPAATLASTPACGRLMEGIEPCTTRSSSAERIHEAHHAEAVLDD